MAARDDSGSRLADAACSGSENTDRGGDPPFRFESPDRLSHGANVFGPGAAATTHERHSQLGGERGESREVRRGGRRHVDPAVTARKNTGVGNRREGRSGLPRVAENLQGAHGPGRAVDTDGEQIEIGKLVHHPCLLFILVRRPFGGEGQKPHQRQVADLADGLDGQGELVKAEEGLEDE